MKRILLIALIFITVSCYTQNTNVMDKLSIIPLGTDIQTFRKELPEVEIPQNKTDFQAGYEEELFGLQCGWAFNFKEGKLNWIMMNSYCDDIDAANFHDYSEAYNRFKFNLEKTFGKPAEDEVHETKFKDPYVERHWGYDVKEALWKTSDMKFKLIFTFMGGKGEYHFLLKLEFQDKDYEYF